MTFAGFPKQARKFLSDLERNNDRDWFADHKDTFERNLLEPARALVDEMGLMIRAFAPDVRAEPKVGGSIFRMHRDTRFSKDKTPLKLNFDMWFWDGEGRSRDRPGFGVRITAKSVALIAGRHAFDPAALAAYRTAVSDPVRRKALESAIRATVMAGPYALGEPSLKRLPRGYEGSDLLRHTGMWVEHEEKTPAELHMPEFVAWCAGHFQAMAPVERWVAEL